MSSKELCSRTNRSARVAAARSVAINRNEDGHQALAAEPSRNLELIEVPVAQDERSSIMSLNDDCFLEIFSHLTLKDLCAVKDCCQRFSYLADSVVQTKSRKKKYVYLPNTQNEESIDEIRENDAPTLVKFGQFIANLRITCSFGRYTSFKRSEFVSIMKSCTSLKSLNLTGRLWLVPVRELRTCFRNIETLELDECCVNTRKLVALLRACQNLKHYIQENVYHYEESYVPSDLCSAIIKYGQNYETIRLKRSSLKTITPSQFLDFVKQLNQLSKLKNIEFGDLWEHSVTVSDMIFLAKCDSLEELILEQFTPSDEFFKTVNNFAKLKLLKLSSNTEIQSEIMASATDFAITSLPSQPYGKYTYTLKRKD